MGREELIRAIMASDQLSYEQAAQRAQVIFNSPNAQSLVSNYQNFARYNPDLLQSVDTNYTSPQITFDYQSMLGQDYSGADPLNTFGGDIYGQEVVGATNPFSINNTGTLWTNEMNTRREQEANTSVNSLPIMQPTQQIQPQNPVQDTLVDTPLSRQQPEQEKNPYDILNPFMYSGGLSADYQAYTAGRMLSKENKTAGDWIGGLSAAGGAGLNVARNVLSGIANTKQSDKTRDWWMEQEMKRQYTPNRTYGDQNSMGGTAYKRGGMVKIKRNGN